MSISCPDVPGNLTAAAWGAKNRVTLYPDKAQTWILARAVDRDQPSNTEVQRMARAVLAKWFSEDRIPPLFDLTRSSGPMDQIEVGVVSTTPPKLATTFQTWSTIPGPLPLLKPGKVLYVPVRFVWRSLAQLTKPWPTWRVTPLGFSGPCPTDADWALYAVGTDVPGIAQPGALPDAGPEIGPADQIVAKLTPGPWIGAALLFFGAAALVNSIRR